MPTRRAFNRMALAGLTGLAASPTRLLASPTVGERKFLFILAYGGWDPCYAFTPLFDNEYAAMPDDSVAAEAHGMTFIDAESRPSVRSFFEDYGDRTCLINGMEVRSITHERCTRILLTGSASPDGDDFASILAAHSANDLILPHVVLSGPAFTNKYSSQVVRVGRADQFPTLIQDQAFQESHGSQAKINETSEPLIDAFVRERADRYAAAAAAGRETLVGAEFVAALDKMNRATDLSDTIEFGSGEIETQVSNALGLLELGVSRCVTVQHNGIWDLTWDTHSANNLQDYHFELLFELLNTTMAELDSRTTATGNPLSEEVTVVVMSEMGRDPRLNALEGKHHWTYTSLMMVGAGVQGGQVLGEFDEYVTGKPLNLSTGEASEDGVAILPGHIGATLLAMGDVDPGDYLPDYDTFDAVVDET